MFSHYFGPTGPALDCDGMEKPLAQSTAYPSFRLMDKDMLRTMGPSCGLPTLRTLPPELLEMIREHSRYSLLWRCISALRLAAYVSASSPEPQLTIPLSQVLLWERAGRLERHTGSSRPHAEQPSWVRITIDFASIKKIERLPQLLPYEAEFTTRSAFIVQEETLISKVMVRLNACIIRHPPFYALSYACGANLRPVNSMDRCFSTCLPLGYGHCLSGTHRRLQV